MQRPSSLSYVHMTLLLSPTRPVVVVAIGATISFESEVTCTLLSNTEMFTSKVYKTAIKRTCKAMVQRSIINVLAIGVRELYYPAGWGGFSRPQLF